TQGLAQAQQLFDADFARRSTRDLDELVLTPDNARTKITELIGRTQRRLFVYNQTLKDSALIDALIDLKRNGGADVRVLLGFQPGFGGDAPDNQPALDKLKAADIPATFFTRRYLHAKVVI